MESLSLKIMSVYLVTPSISPYFQRAFAWHLLLHIHLKKGFYTLTAPESIDKKAYFSRAMWPTQAKKFWLLGYA